MDVVVDPSDKEVEDCDTIRGRNNIEVVLEPTGSKGRYILKADDPEIQAILKQALDSKDRKPRARFRDHVFTRQLSTFDRQNPAKSERSFFGFFTLFWVCMAWLLTQAGLKNWRDYGNILGPNQIMELMFRRDVLVLGITDGAMFASTAVSYLIQLLVYKNYINWSRSGWIVQNLWQSAYIGSVIGWAYYREWPWTHSIFAVLHGLVFLMKQHSYAFYNGYLSGIYRRRALLQRKLSELQNTEPIPSSPNGAESESSSVQLREASQLEPRLTSKTSTNLTDEHSPVAHIASSINNGVAITQFQKSHFESTIQTSIDDLTAELTGKSPTHTTTYPHNLTLGNFLQFTCFPTLVYELTYPRSDSRNWLYILEKLLAVFGILILMNVISQNYIYPLVARTITMKSQNTPMEVRWREFPWIMSDMLFPLLIEQLLTWYLIWECILNVLAELTRFADRGFYGDWWNSVTWDQYARDWNRPVHHFLLRHVYHLSISALRLSKRSATFVTFLLSALVHEMCMAILFGKVRGYLLGLQLMQMPLVMLSRSRLFKGRDVLGNVMFWVGLFLGPSFLMSLYLII
ncbi:acyl-CoA/sterol acyltransferase [Piedraia hortae CBS 480.64]|uniref:O-acyltransferase n=1 Tax=Piedraia hortae CBS 480.64 TaxID=1314780 RepID=A0A6A7BY87_9PEZI|nr:acyl-CoA/sterol acyltransferase [Piedraia hortae CBS 480.64]